MDLTSEAIKTIVELQKLASAAEIVVHGNKSYYHDASRRTLVRLLDDQQAVPGTMKFNTLSGFTDYINENPDKLDISDCHIVVHNEGCAKLFSAMRADCDMRRDLLAEANSSGCEFVFGEAGPGPNHVDPWYDVLDFVIALQSQFVQDQMVDDIIGVLGSLANEKIIENKDNKFTQTLLIRSGITARSEKDIKNPVVLRPFRTFREIDQPASQFILRYQEKEGKGMGIQCALFGADGGAWQLEAMDSIRKFIIGRTKDIPVLC